MRLQTVGDFSSFIGDATEGKEGIDANHTNMCKFASRDDNGYRKVSGEIRRLVNAAPNETPANNTSNTENCWFRPLRPYLIQADYMNAGPDFIPALIRRKILRDKPYNHLNFGEGNSKSTLKLPVLDELSLNVPSSYEVPRTMYFGSSGF